MSRAPHGGAGAEEPGAVSPGALPVRSPGEPAGEAIPAGPAGPGAVDAPAPPPPVPRGVRRRQARGVLPGFGLSLGFTLLYLSVIVLIPLSTVLLRSATLTWSEFWAAVSGARALAAYRLSLTAAFAAAAINAVFGVVVAWVLTRYRFPGRRLVDALVDLPFALPTAVAGIALASLYSGNGWVGRWLEPLGIHVAYTPLGVGVALIFIGLPFVVRTVQPVLSDLDPEIEEAAASLGAGRLATLARVVFPEIAPAVAAGFVLAFARGLGEYGSVIFIAGNMPMRSEIVPLLIMIKLEQYDYAGATAIALVFLAMSFLLLFVINLLAWRRNRALRSTEAS